MSKSYNVPDTQEIRKLIRDINGWIKDLMDATNNLESNYDDTFEGDAFELFGRTKTILKEVIEYIDQ